MSLVVMASLAAGSHIQVLIRILVMVMVIIIIVMIFGDLMKLILMLNPQYLGPLGYSSLGYTSYRTVRSQNEKQEHKFHNCPVYILHPSSAQCHYC